MIGYIYCTITLVFVPAVLIYVATRKLREIRKESFQQKWGGLYDGLRLHKKGQTMFFHGFVMRRFITIVSYRSFANYPIFQILILNFLNLFTIIF